MQLELSDIVKIFNRIDTLERRVAALETRIAELDNNQHTAITRPAFPIRQVSEKYKALAEYLYEKWERKIELDYTKLEDILGFSLPSTAYNYPQSFWANTHTHSYASSWLAIGYKAKVISETKILFERNIYQGE